MSIRIRLLLLFSAIVIILGSVSFYALKQYQQTLEGLQLLQSKTQTAVELSYQAETLINNQLNVWKNILIRGSKEHYYHDYLQQFYETERAAKSKLKTLLHTMSDFPQVQDKALKLVETHKQIGKKFRQALRVFNSTTLEAATVADEFMSGIEMQPVNLITEISNEIRNYRNASLSEYEAYKSRQQNYLLSGVVSITLISILIYLLLVDRHVAIPAQQASALAETMQTAQRVAKFGTWNWTERNETHNWSDGFYDILNIEKTSPPSKELFIKSLHEDDREHVEKSINQALAEKSSFEFEARVRLPENRERVFQLRGEVSISQSDGQSLTMTSILYDITERIESERRLSHLANYDPLTDLPNRNLFHERLSHAMARSRRNNSKIALLYFDLDHFKAVNDALGHQAGDILLKEAARRIVENIREEDTVARLGGDEFVIILEQFNNTDHIAHVAHHVLEKINDTYLINTNQIYVSASMGITIFPDDGSDTETLLKNADAAMYLAKEDGRNTYHFFTAELNRIANEKLRLENSLRLALEREEFQLNFQPQIDLKSGEVIGVEALLRWLPNQNPVSPARFIPVLEDTGMIIPVGNWVLEQSIATLREIHQKGFNKLRMAVNLSSRQLRQAEIIHTIKETLEKYDMAPGFLEAELTESIIIDESLSKNHLAELEKQGVSLAIDDFGTGYSSLSYLKRYSVDILKIDRSFISDITHDKDDDAVTSAIIALSHQLDMQVIAEGIETENQLQFLQKAGCDIGQGFLIARPMNKKQLLNWLNQLTTDKAMPKWSQEDIIS